MADEGRMNIMASQIKELPIIPRLPETVPTRPDGAIATCGECGRTIYRADYYCCMNDRCPVQLKVTW